MKSFKLDDLEVGDIFHMTVDEGAGMWGTLFFRIEKKGRKKVQIRTEYGDIGWKYPEWLFATRSTPEFEKECNVVWKDLR